jgi:hypothetical protein
VGVHLSDGVHNRDATLSLRVEDDAPVAHSDTASAGAVRTNLLVTLDISSSMETHDGVGGASRLASAIEAVGRLIDLYDALGDVAVRLVTFSGDAQAVGEVWTDAATARQLLAALESGNGTNYDSALAAAQQAFASPGQLAGGQNVAYFLSDGEPNRGREVDATDAQRWEAFLAQHDITSHAIGLGSGTTPAAMDGIAYDGQAGTDSDALQVVDFAQLDGVLASTVRAPVSGELIAGGGADGAHVHTLSVDGATYTYAPGQPGAVVEASGASGAGHYDAGTGVLTVTLAHGGQLAVQLDTGHYSFTPGTTESQTPVAFTLIDGDGDTAAGTLGLAVTGAAPPPSSPPAPPDDGHGDGDGGGSGGGCGSGDDGDHDGRGGRGEGDGSGGDGHEGHGGRGATGGDARDGRDGNDGSRDEGDKHDHDDAVGHATAPPCVGGAEVFSWHLGDAGHGSPTAGGDRADSTAGAGSGSGSGGSCVDLRDLLGNDPLFGHALGDLESLLTGGIGNVGVRPGSSGSCEPSSPAACAPVETGPACPVPEPAASGCPDPQLIAQVVQSTKVLIE